jgi:signal transduction histidine kinase
MTPGKREEDLRDANLSLYLRSLSHDFNNLLGAILGNAALLSTLVPGDSEAARTAAVIERAAHRAAGLAALLAKASRLDPPALEPTDLSPAAREVADLLRASTPGNITIETLADPAPVQGDPLELHQLLLNLALNARDAVSASLSGLIVIRTGTRDGRSFLSVRDNGPGVPAELRARIFEPFFSTKSGESSPRGIGLAIVDRAARRHGAQVELISEPGEGAEFRVLFPHPR